MTVEWPLPEVYPQLHTWLEEGSAETDQGSVYIIGRSEIGPITIPRSVGTRPASLILLLPNCWGPNVGS